MYNETLSLSLLAAIVVLGIIMVIMVSLIRKRLSDTEQKLDGKGFKALFHILAFFFLFPPFVLWPVMAIPALVAIPAVIALFVAFVVSRRIDAQSRLLVALFAIASSGLWVCDGIYEYQMRLWAQTVTGPIRIDLLLLMPFLYYSGMSFYHLTKISGIFSGNTSKEES
jgi:hypothetical protein